MKIDVITLLLPMQIMTSFGRVVSPITAAIVAIAGVGALFGVSSVSKVVEQAAPAIQGRLVVFFPGEVEDNNYRLLDARDGWNYMAHAITGD